MSLEWDIDKHEYTANGRPHWSVLMVDGDEQFMIDCLKEIYQARNRNSFPNLPYDVEARWQRLLEACYEQGWIGPRLNEHGGLTFRSLAKLDKWHGDDFVPEDYDA